MPTISDETLKEVLEASLNGISPLSERAIEELANAAGHDISKILKVYEEALTTDAEPEEAEDEGDQPMPVSVSRTPIRWPWLVVLFLLVCSLGVPGRRFPSSPFFH